MIQLGQKGRDVITGFEGTCTGKCQYISGCNQALLTPHGLTSEGKTKEGFWFDEQRIQVTDEARIVLDNGDTPGPDKEAPKR